MAIPPERPPAPRAPVGGHGGRDAARTEQRIRHGAGWILWIGGLSLVAVGGTALGSDMSFALGLTAAQFVTMIGLELGVGAGVPAAGYLGATVGAALALVFGALFVPAQTGKPWAFVLALVLYGLDAALLLALSIATENTDVLGVVVHGWALWALFRGYRAAQAPG